MYFKITNQKECHNGYQYQDGLNILDKPFEKDGSCAVGGLYFTTLEHLNKFYDYGVWLREIRIPEDAEMVEDPGGNKWRADKIILGERYPLFDLGTIQKFNLKINRYFIRMASWYGCLDILEWWLKTFDPQLTGTSLAVDAASRNGQVDVLEWWLRAMDRSGLKFKFSADAIDGASENGHLEVLEWWLKSANASGVKLKYTSRSIDEASKKGHVEILKWWWRAHVEFGLELKSFEDVPWMASKYGHLKILEWWKNSGLKLRDASLAIHWASWCGHKDVLEWWLGQGKLD